MGVRGITCTYTHVFEQVSSVHSSTRASQNQRSHSAAPTLHPLTLPLIPFSAPGLNFPAHSSCTYNLAHEFSFLKPIHPLFLCALNFFPPRLRCGKCGITRKPLLQQSKSLKIKKATQPPSFILLFPSPALLFLSLQPKPLHPAQCRSFKCDLKLLVWI